MLLCLCPASRLLTGIWLATERQDAKLDGICFLCVFFWSALEWLFFCRDCLRSEGLKVKLSAAHLLPATTRIKSMVEPSVLETVENVSAFIFLLCGVKRTSILPHDRASDGGAG